MWHFCEHSLDTARRVRGVVCFLAATLNLLFLLVPASHVQTTAGNSGQWEGCGTTDTPFEAHKCQRLLFDGEVTAGQTFEKKISDNLIFRLNPKTALSGWMIEVGPEKVEDPARTEYVWVVNPPYRSWNTSFLDTSYGIKASDAVAYPPREFNFVLTESQFKRATDLVEILIMSRPPSDKRPQEEIDQEWNQAQEALAKFPVAKGRLTILNSRVTDSGKSGTGSIDWLKFSVELHLPCRSAGNKAKEIVVDTTNCSPAVSGRRE